VRPNHEQDASQLDEVELIARSLDEPEAFGGLLERHHRPVYRYLSRRLPVDAAEECAQETFTRAFAARRTFRPYRDSALPWLYGIATNVVRERRREEQRVLAGPRAPVVAWDDADDAVDRVDAAEMRRRLGEALAELSPVDRDIVMLAAVAELSAAEIATALDTDPRTVSTRLWRSLGRLRQTLDGQILGSERSLHG
jgi:RNA polymerase sigma-70 factor (ECF subfamily)